MWSSQSPKLLHISPRWLVITDRQKKVDHSAVAIYWTLIISYLQQVTYTEVMIASVGSLSYAEDENRHILGIKTNQPATASGSTLSEGDLKDLEGKFCCHVLECDSEVIGGNIRILCVCLMDVTIGDGSSDMHTSPGGLPTVFIATASRRRQAKARN